MDLASPLRSLIPSMESAVLEVLAGTESGLGTTQIARLARRGTRPGHQKALDRLAEHGLVLAEPSNNGFVYRLNREHVLVPALTTAMNARQVVIKRLADAIRQLEPTPTHASLFGSFARHEGTPHSDIDLLVVVPAERERHSPDWQRQIQRLEDEVYSWTGNRLEVLAFSLSTLADAVRAGEPIIESLRDESAPLIGVRFATLVAALTDPAEEAR